MGAADGTRSSHLQHHRDRPVRRYGVFVGTIEWIQLDGRYMFGNARVVVFANRLNFGLLGVGIVGLSLVSFLVLAWKRRTPARVNDPL